VEIVWLVWPEHNIAKLREHRIRRREVDELVRQGTYAAEEHPDYPRQVRITGYTPAGRWLTIVLEELGAGGYRPVTGWVATEDEVRRYFEET
jgi:hypothetical protein